MYRINCLFIAILLVATGGAFAAPESINYQGKIHVNGEPLDGMGEFKFAIVNGSGGTYWTNDGTVPPVNSHAVSVNNGLFSIIIGEDGGMLPLPETLFDEDDRRLRVWFNDQITGWQQLVPDQMLVSVPFALQTVHAETASSADYAASSGTSSNAAYATNSGNADTVDNKHASELTRARGTLGLNYCIALQGTFPSRSAAAEGQVTNVSRAVDPYIGEIMLFAGNFAPQGWALCHGQILQISQNTALFSIIGTTYGGDGRVTFGLPDLRGRTPIGVGTGPGGSPVSWGQKCGTPGCAETE